MSFRTTKIKLPIFNFHPDAADLSDLLEIFQEAFLLIDASSGRIKLANSKAAELTGYTQEQLVNVELSQILPDAREYQPQSSPNPIDTAPPQKLIQRNKHQEHVGTIVYPLASRKKLFGIQITPVSRMHLQQAQDQRINQTWKIIDAAESAIQGAPLKSTLDQALSTISSLCGAESVFVYQANSTDLKLEQRYQHGPSQDFPLDLPPNEFVNLRLPYLWKPGKRLFSSLHHLANLANLAYLATVPIGEPDAAIGIMVFAGQKLHFPDIDLSHFQICADFTAAIIQKYSQFVNLENDLKHFKEETNINHFIQDHIDDGIVLISPSFEITHMNSAAEKLLGFSKPEAVGMSIEKIFVSETSIIPMLQQILTSNRADPLRQLNLYHRSGTNLPVEMAVYPLNGHDGLEHILIVFNDNSKAIALSEQIKHLEQQAALGEYQRDFAHEIRNPLNNINAGLQLMARSLPSDDPTLDTISRIKQDMDRMAELMDTILSYTKLSPKDVELIDIGAVALRSIDRCKSKLSNTKIHQHHQIEPSLPPIKGNRRALEQVFVNLIDNAIRVLKANGGTLAVKVNLSQQHSGPGFIEVRVTDSGPGIPPVEIDQIFQPFHTTHDKGTGLGLVISKRIINSHKGEIDFTSFPGGTIFRIRLPIAEQTEVIQ